MNFYRTFRNFVGDNFIAPLEVFFAVNYPAFYDDYFYNVKHRARRENCGEVFFTQMNGYEDFIQLKRENDFALKIPTDFPVTSVKFKVAAIVHIFYLELVDEIKNLLQNIPCAVDVYISTNSPEQKNIIEKSFADFDKGRVTVKIFANRGRNIAPAFAGFREIYDDYDVCVHIHTKKSPHNAHHLAGWREHLYRNLLGSPEIVGGILKILSDERVGMVFPQYFAPMRIFINWGKNYLVTKNFLHKLGIEIDNRNLIEFPAGSMFWFKPKALAPLLDNGLTFDDFPDEIGQLDGTLAHAIERSFLFIVEAAGFRWVKVTADDRNFGLTPTLKSHSQAELDANIVQAWHSVLKRY